MWLSDMHSSHRKKTPRDCCEGIWCQLLCMLRKKKQLDKLMIRNTNRQRSILLQPRLKTYLEIAFGSESSSTDSAGERFLPSVRPFMDLQGTRRGEGLSTGVAIMLLRCPPRRGWRKHWGWCGSLWCRQAHRRLLGILVGAVEEAVDLCLDHGGQGAGGEEWRTRAWGGGLKELWGQVSHLVSEHVLLEVTLGREATVAGCANERSLFGMASVMNVQGTLAGEGLAADVTCCVLEGAALTEGKHHGQGIFWGVTGCQI